MDESPPDRVADPADEPLRRIADVALGALVVAVVLMGAVASLRGWLPTGDDAFLSLRTRHVLSTDPILLNNASSGGPSAGSRYNHPGAFPLTLLAPITMLGGPGALALATALVGAGWIALIGLMARRVAGAGGQLVATLGAAALAWSMGSSFLVDPWNPIFGVWPIAALVVATWGVRRGSVRMLPVVVLAASVAFQTHLSLTVLSFALAAWATGAAAWTWWRARAAGDAAVAGVATRSFAFSAVVGLVANAQMLADQVGGTGNLGKILRGTGFREATLSLRQIAAVVASRFALPRWWLRGSWSSPVFLPDLPSVLLSLVGLLVVVVLTVLAVRWARVPRADGGGVARCPHLTALFEVLAVGLLVGALVATKFPLRVGVPLPYLRWLWPMAAIWTVAVLVPVGSWVAVRAPAVRQRAPVVALGVGVVLTAWAFAPANAEVDPNPSWAQDLARELAPSAVRAARRVGPVVVPLSIQEQGLWTVGALIDQLDAAGLEPRVDDPVLLQQTDDAYRVRGDERWQLLMLGGLDIDDAPPASLRLARVDALSRRERAELERLTAALAPVLDAGGAVRLTAVGRAETDAHDLAHLTTGDLSPGQLLRSVPFHLALERGAIEVRGATSGATARRLVRASALGALDGGRSVALYLAPVT